MAKRTWIYIGDQAYEKGTEPVADALLVMGDIEPYRSTIDGTLITSRSQHREHLRAHGCVEIGNDTAHLLKDRRTFDVQPEQRKELIRAQIDAMSHADFKRALRRDIERVKWNSRED